MERYRKRLLTDFGMGLIVGFIAAAIIFGVVAFMVCSHNREKEIAKEIIEYAEKQQIIEESCIVRFLRLLLKITDCVFALMQRTNNMI